MSNASSKRPTKVSESAFSKPKAFLSSENSKKPKTKDDPRANSKVPASKPEKRLKKKIDADKVEEDGNAGKKRLPRNKAEKKPDVPDERVLGSISAPTKSAGKKQAKPASTKRKKKRASLKPPTPPPDPSEEVEDEGEESSAADEDADATTHLHGFSTDDEDSSDEDIDVDDAPADVTKLPTIAKDDETVKKRLEKAKRLPTADRGVCYLGRVPHGFYEDQIRAYFSQFGTVTRLRLSRNKKTGKSKHYGFIEFDSSTVAQIVADTMNNYLLMGHLLQCKVIPKAEVHAELWVGANRKWRVIPRDRIARVKHNKARTVGERNRAEAKLLRRQAERKRKLAEAGIDYEFDAIAYKKKKKSSEP